MNGKKDMQICFQYQNLAGDIPFCVKILEYSSSISPRREKLSVEFLSRYRIHSAIRGGLFGFLPMILNTIQQGRSVFPNCILEVMS